MKRSRSNASHPAPNVAPRTRRVMHHTTRGRTVLQSSRLLATPIRQIVSGRPRLPLVSRALTMLAHCGRVYRREGHAEHYLRSAIDPRCEIPQARPDPLAFPIFGNVTILVGPELLPSSQLAVERVEALAAAA